MNELKNIVNEIQTQKDNEKIGNLRIVGIFSFCNAEHMWHKYEKEIKEIIVAISSMNIQPTKKSEEKTKKGKILFSPILINQLFDDEISKVKENNLSCWQKKKINCEYSTKYYLGNYNPPKITSSFREMDFVSNRNDRKIGIEVQLGKYAFMVYNVCAKMTIFHNLEIIDFGVEIVPIKTLQGEMSTGVSYFEQFTWDLEKRKESNIDIPVLIFGIGHTDLTPK